MSESTSPGAWVAILAIIGLTVVSFALVMQSADRPTASQEQHTLTATGTHVLEVAPDQAVILMDVITRDPVAKTASEMNRGTMIDVMAALNAQGLSASDIETTGVTLTPVQDWDPKDQMYINKGYEQRTTLKVTVKDLTKVGNILDTAVSAGANNVQDISFELQPASENRYKQQALADATKVATAKAQILADAAGTSLGDVTSVSENSYNYVPWVYNAKQVAAGADSVPTPISPQKVAISVSVTVSYELR